MGLAGSHASCWARCPSLPSFLGISMDQAWPQMFSDPPASECWVDRHGGIRDAGSVFCSRGFYIRTGEKAG